MDFMMFAVETKDGRHQTFYFKQDAELYKAQDVYVEHAELIKSAASMDWCPELPEGHFSSDWIDFRNWLLRK